MRSTIAALLAAMIPLAVIPSPSVFAVVARSMASGFMHGVVTTIGIVVGDCFFIILAIYGLSAIAQIMGSLLVVIKYFGSIYLIWLGIKLIRAKAKILEVEGIKEFSWFSSFLCGLLITLSDPKAILFYMSFFPAFIDLSNLSFLDTATILLTATVAVGGVKLGYAYMADRAKLLWKNPRANKIMDIIAGSVIIGTGIVLVVKT